MWNCRFQGRVVKTAKLSTFRPAKVPRYRFGGEEGHFSDFFKQSLVDKFSANFF